MNGKLNNGYVSFLFLHSITTNTHTHTRLRLISPFLASIYTQWWWCLPNSFVVLLFSSLLTKIENNKMLPKNITRLNAIQRKRNWWLFTVVEKWGRNLMIFFFFVCWNCWKLKLGKHCYFACYYFRTCAELSTLRQSCIFLPFSLSIHSRSLGFYSLSLNYFKRERETNKWEWRTY